MLWFFPRPVLVPEWDKAVHSVSVIYSLDDIGFVHGRMKSTGTKFNDEEQEKKPKKIKISNDDCLINENVLSVKQELSIAFRLVIGVDFAVNFN